MRITGLCPEHSQGTQDWTGVGKVLCSLRLNAALRVVAAEPDPFTCLPASLRILMVIRLPTDLASFLKDGAFNQMKSTSWTFQQSSSRWWFPLILHMCQKLSSLLSPWISQQWAKRRGCQWARLASADTGVLWTLHKGKRERKTGSGGCCSCGTCLSKS